MDTDILVAADIQEADEELRAAPRHSREYDPIGYDLPRGQVFRLKLRMIS